MQDIQIAANRGIINKTYKIHCKTATAFPETHNLREKSDPAPFAKNNSTWTGNGLWHRPQAEDIEQKRKSEVNLLIITYLSIHISYSYQVKFGMEKGLTSAMKKISGSIESGRKGIEAD